MQFLGECDKFSFLSFNKLKIQPDYFFFQLSVAVKWSHCIHCKICNCLYFQLCTNNWYDSQIFTNELQPAIIFLSSEFHLFLPFEKVLPDIFKRYAAWLAL